MTTVVDWRKVSGDGVAQSLHEALEKLNSAEGEVLLDFSEVRRINPSGLHAMEEFANEVDKKTLRVSLRGVNVDVYKVLKLARLTGRYLFVN